MPKKYDEKRQFEKTPEPKMVRKADGSGPLTFVIQKHDATALHYDLRLELDGVLKSWAVPKGPSYNPKDKRLAMLVEDHPLDYASFEGVIPKGNYGAGEVIVWDNGTYSPDEDGRILLYDRDEAEKEMRKGLEEGKISVFLQGSKLKGSFALVRMKKENEWLFFKHNDEFANPERDILIEEASVISGLTLGDFKKGVRPDAVPHVSSGVKPEDLVGSRRAAFPKTLEPMTASLADAPFSHPDWIFEPKMDGIRAIAFKNGDQLRLETRKGNDISKRYPNLMEQIAKQLAEQLVIDGEIVALDDKGVPSFHRLQQRMNLDGGADIHAAEIKVPVFYNVFDILYLDGYDVTGCPLVDRKTLLKKVLLPTEAVSVLDGFEEHGEIAYKAIVDNGLEGVVAKRRSSRYEAGKRSANWLKIKSTMSDEFLIGGYSKGLGGRSGTFGALLLGTRDEDGKLIYVGHVGSGFNDKSLSDYKTIFEEMKTDKNPFTSKPPLKTPATWMEPRLIAEVKFNQWTSDGHLRAPVFLRMREDLSPEDVHKTEVVQISDALSTTGATAGVKQEDIENVVEQVKNGKNDFSILCCGNEIPITNSDKLLWLAADGHRGFSKRDLLIYYAKVSQYLLPHLLDRPLTLSRYPNGIDGGMFYQKHWEHKLPPFVEIVRLYSEHNKDDQEYLACNNLQTLLWLAQLADIELHPWTSRTNPEPDAHELSIEFTGSEEAIDESVLNYPDFLLFDIDPYIYSGKEAKGAEPEYNKRAFDKGREAAFWVKELLDSLSLQSFIKTSGKTGLHIYVPILRHFTYDEVRSAAATVCNFVLRAHPEDITTQWAVTKRTGKIFMDYNQNSRGKTLSAIYSPRALPNATVSTPISWEELTKTDPADFTVATVPVRLEKHGDAWAEILKAKNDLKSLLG